MPDLTLSPDPGGASVNTAAFVVQWLRTGDRLFLNYRDELDPWIPPHCIGPAAALDALIAALTLLWGVREKGVQDG